MAQGLFNLKQVNQAIQQGGWSAQKPPQVEYLVVAGGGSGGGGAGYAGGGGGAGGFVAGMALVPNNQTVLVTIGAGGVADSGTGNGTSGGNSVFGQIVAIGGGYGSYGQGSSAASGGSGGGNGCNGGRYGQGTPGQGNIGGLGYGTTSGSAGGGGGAGAVGAPVGAYTTYPGNGGVGAASAITGTITTYAGGGGGSANNSGNVSAGGLGGGGAGASGTSTNAVAGTANTGGGGGGAGNQSSGTRVGGNGGSGIVVISYPDTYAAAASTTGSPTVSTSGSGSLNFVKPSSQSLVLASNSAFALGTGNFTWECWVNFTSANDGALFDLGGINTAGGFGVFRSVTTLFVRIDGSGNDLTYTPASGFENNWIHLAVVRNSSTLTLYYNGTSVASGTRTNNVTQSTPYIGQLLGIGGYYLNAYVSNMRLVKGTAVYTGNFTPSTTPLTTVSGTSLLLNTVSGSPFTDGSSNYFTPATGYTSPSWDALSPFATGLGYKNRVYTWTSSGSITF